MKVLFTHQPSFGHFHPLVPFARALGARGHEIAFASAPNFCAKLESNGFRAFRAGAHDTAEAEVLYRAHVATLPTDQRADYHFEHVYAARAKRTVPDLLNVIDIWKPDAVVRENTEFGGCIAAEHAGLVHAVLQITPMWPTLTHAVAGSLARLRASLGMPPDSVSDILYRHLLLWPRPMSLWHRDVPVPPTLSCFRNANFSESGDEVLPEWVSTLDGRPTVYASLGTYYNRVTEVLAAILEGLRHEPINLVMTIGRNQDSAQFGVQPSNVHIERYIPQDLLLPYCDAVVFHGGSGTMMGALSHGLPLVIAPLGAEQPENAARCVDAGVARVVDAQCANLPSVLRDAVRHVLGDPAPREAARHIQQQIHQLPGLEAPVSLLEELVRSHRPFA